MESDFDLLEPAPDIHALFQFYNDLYFGGSLGQCSVEWSSPRMTMCGGTCEWREGWARIKLSTPLLQIHAYVFIVHRGRDDSGHGSRFVSKMHEINRSTVPDFQRPPGGYNITTTHDWYAEVDHYRQHIWKCERCNSVVRRANNRAPQEADCIGRKGSRGDACRDERCRWHVHLRMCGGTYAKIAEPEGYGDKKGKRDKAGTGAAGSGAAAGGGAPKRPKLPQNRGPTIDDFFKPRGGGGGGNGGVDAAVRAEARAEVAGEACGAAAAQHSGRANGASGGGGSGGGGVHGGTAPQPAADDMRRLLADAALRRLQGVCSAETGRLQGGGGSGRPEHSAASGSALAPSDAGDAPVSPGGGTARAARAGAASSPVTVRGALPTVVRAVAEVVDLVGEDGEAGGAGIGGGGSGGGGREGGAAAGAEGGGGRVRCPLCGEAWAAGCISNAELNAHVDVCLAKLAGG